jgi:formylmethanofuran dehydrogenase subunit E
VDEEDEAAKELPKAKQLIIDDHQEELFDLEIVDG